MRRFAILLGLVALASSACGDDDADGEQAEALADPVYGGYSDDPAVAWPDFTHPDRRWDDSYPDDCAGTGGDDAFACFEQKFWQVFQFDWEARPATYAVLRAHAERIDADGQLTAPQRTRLWWRLGQLGVAMLAEQREVSALAHVEADLTRAVELEPDNTILQAWLSTVKINTAVAIGADFEPLFDALWRLYLKDPPAVSGTVMIVAAGLPKSSGWPAVAEQMIDEIDMTDCGQWCGWSFDRAPMALPGQYHSYAEVYARVGRAEDAKRMLEMALAGRNGDSYPWRAELEAGIADIDAYVAPYAERGDDQGVTDLMLTGNEGACMACHAPLPAR